MTAYYNEIDPFAAHCLRALIADGVIAPGDVDERSIVDVQPDDLKGYTQCHFFAGGGLWSVAARMAGISDDEQLWTGSCPCQPLSVAGQGKGADDERHLWPAFFRLISERNPAILFGEQVASALGREWFAGVRLDLENLGHACGSADLCAAGVGAPHIRQRLYWVALGNANISECQTRDAFGSRAETRSECLAQPSLCGDMVDPAGVGRREGRPEYEFRSGWSAIAGASGGDMADAESIGRRGWQDDEDSGRREQPLTDSCAGGGAMADAKSVSKRKQDDNMRAEPRQDAWPSSGGSGERHGLCDVADADDAGSQRHWRFVKQHDQSRWAKSNGRSSATGLGHWSDAEWRTGADGKARRVKPGVRLLADGFPGRVGQLRIAGNAIVPQVAAAFMTAVREAV